MGVMPSHGPGSREGGSRLGGPMEGVGGRRDLSADAEPGDVLVGREPRAPQAAGLLGAGTRGWRRSVSETASGRRCHRSLHLELWDRNSSNRCCCWKDPNGSCSCSWQRGGRGCTQIKEWGGRRISATPGPRAHQGEGHGPREGLPGPLARVDHQERLLLRGTAHGGEVRGGVGPANEVGRVVGSGLRRSESQRAPDALYVGSLAVRRTLLFRGMLGGAPFAPFKRLFAQGLDEGKLNKNRYQPFAPLLRTGRRRPVGPPRWRRTGR